MFQNIVLIGSLKNIKNNYSIFNELLAKVVESLAQKFDQVYAINTYFRVTNSKINQIHFDINSQNFQSFITNHNINAVFTLSGGKLVQSFIYQFFTEHPEERQNIKLVGSNYHTLKILSNRFETEKILLSNNINFPNVKIIDPNRKLNLSDNPLQFPTRLRIIKPKTHSLGLFYNFESLLQAIQENSDKKNILQMEESALGDKEIEVVALRDKYQNIHILIHNEKIDPVGVHRDHSIVIYPTVTLLAREIDEIDRITQRIIKELMTPIVQIRFAISQDHQYKVLSIRSDLTTSELIVSKIRNINIAQIIVELACGKTILDISHKYDNLLAKDLDFFTFVAPYHEVDNPSVKDLTSASFKRSNSLIIMMETDLSLGIKNTLSELEGPYREKIRDYLVNFSDTYLVRQMMNVRIFRLFFIIEAIRRDFLIEDLAEITRIDQGYLQLLKIVANLWNKKDTLIENNWQNPNYKNWNTLFPVKSQFNHKLKFDKNDIVISFDTKKVDHYSSVYRYYLRKIVEILSEKKQKIVLLNNSFDNFNTKGLKVVQLPFEIIKFPFVIGELKSTTESEYEFGIIKYNGQTIVSRVIKFKKNHQVQQVLKPDSFLKQITINENSIAVTVGFNLDESGKIKNLKVNNSLSKAFYFSDSHTFKEAIILFVDAKLNL